jgi:hypothetical protein
MKQNNRYASGEAPRVDDVVMCVRGCRGAWWIKRGALMVVEYWSESITDRNYPRWVNDYEVWRFYKIGRL